MKSKSEINCSRLLLSTFFHAISENKFSPLLLAILISPSLLAEDMPNSKNKKELAPEKIVVHGKALDKVNDSLPNPVSIITASDIERKQVTNMTDLLRGEFPGVFVLNSGLNDWTTQVFTRGNTSWNYGTSDLNGDYMKIFIDGIELVRPTLLSTLSPSMIESIEVVRGPASGIMYGSEGASGIMKIKTKKGMYGGTLTHPEITLQLNSGIMDSKYSPDNVTPKVQDHYIQLAGGDSDFSYRLGVSHQSVGEWAYRYNSSNTTYSAGLHGQIGLFSLDFTGFHNKRDLEKSDFSFSCTRAENHDSKRCQEQRETGKNSEYGLNYPMEENLYALTVLFQPSENASQTLTFGQDKNTFSSYGKYPVGNIYSNADYTMRTLRYFHEYKYQYGSNFTAKYTAGLDSIFYKAETIRLDRFTWGPNGEMIPNPSFPPDRDGDDQWHKFGYYGMTELGYKEKLFLTLAARVDNDIRNVGQDKRRKTQPRIGLSYILNQDNGSIKLRGQWGESVRPPVTGKPIEGSASWYPTVPDYLPNTNIGPELKVGWDAGIDFVWNGLGSLSVTRFDEKGRNLIMPVALDANSAPPIRQYQNVGIIENKGWEFDLKMYNGPFSLDANLTLIDNKIKRLSNVYNDDSSSIYKEGDRRFDVPRYTAGLTAGVDVFGGTISANAYWLGKRPKSDGDDLPRLWRLNLRAERPINDWITILARIDNVFRDQDSDRSDTTISPGRTFMLGTRMIF